MLAATIGQHLGHPLGAAAALTGAALCAFLVRRHAFAVVATLVAVLFLVGHLGPRAVRTETPSQAVERRVARMGQTLASLADSAREAIGDARDPALVFPALMRVRRPREAALSVFYDSALVAWSGITGPAQPPEVGLHLIGSDDHPTLSLTTHADHLTIVAEHAFLPLAGDLTGLRVTRARAPDHDASMDGPALPEGVAQHVIHAPDGRPVAVIAYAERRERFRLPPFLACLALVLLNAGLATATARSLTQRPSAAALGTTLAFIVGARLAARSPGLVQALPIFGPSSLAVVSPLDLVSSPGDLCLTGIAAAAAAAALLLAAWAPRREEASARLGPALALVPLLALVTATLLGALFTLLRRVADNSDMALDDFSLVPFDPVRVAVLVGLTLLFLSQIAIGAGLLARLLDPARHPNRQPLLVAAAASSLWLGAGVLAQSIGGPGTSSSWVFLLAFLLPLAVAFATVGRVCSGLVLAGATGILATTLLYVAAHSEHRRSLHSFLANDLAASLERHDEVVRRLLDDITGSLNGRLGANLVGRPPSDRAYQVWKMTRLSHDRLRSAIDVREPDGKLSRFSFRLSLPPDLRDVSPGTVTLQEVTFQGRPLRVLAGAEQLPDGSVVAVRIAQDYQSLPFFPDTHHLRDLLVPGSFLHAQPLIAAGAALTVVDESGHVVYSPARISLPLNDWVLDRVLRTAGPFWWQTEVEGRTYDVVSFASADRVLFLSLPRPPMSSVLAGLLHAVIFAAFLALGGLVALMGWSTVFRSDLLRGDWILGSYYRKTFLGFVLGAMVPALGFSLYLRSTVETQKLQELRSSGAASLEFARRILAELQAGEPGLPLDDRTLIWVSQTVGHDLALYHGTRLEATSMRDLFLDGVLAERPDAESYHALAITGAPIHLALRRFGNPIALAASTALGGDRILSLFSVTDASDIEQAAAARNQLLFLATAGLVGAAAVLARFVTRRATRPVRDLTDAAERVGAGDLEVRIVSTRRDEVRNLVEGFNRMTGLLRGQREELKARAAFLSRLLENAPIGILSIDADRVVTTANAEARELLMAPLEPGSSLLAALASGIPAPLTDRLLAAPTGDKEELELVIPGPAQARTVRAVMIQVPLGEPSTSGRLVLLQDVSDIIKSKKLEAWAEMARRIAHEIKNPLTPIQLAAEHTRRVYRDRHPDFPRVLDECVATILRQVRDLRRIAREFSAYAAGPRPVQRETVDVASWLADVMAPYLVAPRPGLEVSLVVDPGCGQQRLDADRLQRALVNLLENALQALPSGGTVRLEAARNAGGELTIEVSDNGIGFPAELKERLFEPYFSTKDTGSGLGLANARQAVEDHGGRMAIDSAPGSRTRVTLWLPGDGPPVSS